MVFRGMTSDRNEVFRIIGSNELVQFQQLLNEEFKGLKIRMFRVKDKFELAHSFTQIEEQRTYVDQVLRLL